MKLISSILFSLRNELIFIQSFEMNEEIPQIFDFFVPPPISKLNKQYYQQLKNANNPVSHGAKYYTSFQEVLMFDQPNKFKGERLTEDHKETLIYLNKKLYNDMLKCLQTFSGASPIESIKFSIDPIKEDITKFMNIVQSVKRYETRREICKLMVKQTKLIKQRTAEMIEVLDGVKKGFHDMREKEERVQNTGE